MSTKSMAGCLLIILPGILAMSLSFFSPVLAEASLRKCSGSAGSSESERILLMVDGVVVGDIETSTGADGDFWYSTPGGNVTVSRAQIEYIIVTCVERVVDGQIVVSGAISLVTRGGAEGMLRRYLTELADLQEGYRRANGEYAAAAEQAGFRLTPQHADLEMNVVNGGWSATVAAETSSTRACRIAVGTATAPGAASGEVKCFDRPE